MSSVPIPTGTNDPLPGSENPSLLITAKECAALLGISVSNWYKQLSLGRVPKPVRIGRMVRWLRQEILDWLKDGCPVPKPPSNRK